MCSLKPSRCHTYKHKEGHLCSKPWGKHYERFKVLYWLVCSFACHIVFVICCIDSAAVERHLWMSFNMSDWGSVRTQKPLDFSRLVLSGTWKCHSKAALSSLQSLWFAVVDGFTNTTVNHLLSSWEPARHKENTKKALQISQFRQATASTHLK